MMHLTYTETLEQPNLFFIPMLLKSRLLMELRRQNIPYRSYLYKNLPPHNNEDYQKAATAFRNAGWNGDTNRMAGILCRIPPKNLFQACTMLFGPNMDPEEKQKQKELEEMAQSSYLENYADIDYIPIHKKEV